jgi:predicted DNA-binding transcriptional regulator AlpA
MTIKLEIDLGPDAQKVISLLQNIADQHLPHAHPARLQMESSLERSSSVTQETSFLNEKAVARQLSVSLALLRKWRLFRSGPPFVKVGRLVRYRQADVDRWIAARVTS